MAFCFVLVTFFFLMQVPAVILGDYQGNFALKCKSTVGLDGFGPSLFEYYWPLVTTPLFALCLVPLFFLVSQRASR